MRALDQIEAELTERKRYYRGAIKDALDRLPPMTRIQVMTETVDGVTSGGEDHAPGLIDDLVDTAGTICKAAALLKEKGANTVRAICTHPVLSGNAYENIQNSALEELVVSDTIPLKQVTSKIKVLTVSDLFAKAIRKNHDHESISSLFIRL